MEHVPKTLIFFQKVFIKVCFWDRTVNTATFILSKISTRNIKSTDEFPFFSRVQKCSFTVDEKKCQKFMLNFGSINYFFVHLW